MPAGAWVAPFATIEALLPAPLATAEGAGSPSSVTPSQLPTAGAQAAPDASLTTPLAMPSAVPADAARWPQRLTAQPTGQSPPGAPIPTNMPTLTAPEAAEAPAGLAPQAAEGRRNPAATQRASAPHGAPPLQAPPAAASLTPPSPDEPSDAGPRPSPPSAPAPQWGLPSGAPSPTPLGEGESVTPGAAGPAAHHLRNPRHPAPEQPAAAAEGPGGERVGLAGGPAERRPGPPPIPANVDPLGQSVPDRAVEALAHGLRAVAEQAPANDAAVGSPTRFAPAGTGLLPSDAMAEASVRARATTAASPSTADGPRATDQRDGQPPAVAAPNARVGQPPAVAAPNARVSQPSAEAALNVTGGDGDNAAAAQPPGASVRQAARRAASDTASEGSMTERAETATLAARAPAAQEGLRRGGTGSAGVPQQGAVARPASETSGHGELARLAALDAAGTDGPPAPGAEGDGGVEAEELGPRQIALSQARAREEMPALMVQGARGAWRHGSSRLRVDLRPPDLGAVRVAFELRDGTLTGSIAVEREDVLEWVESQLPAWREELADAGMQVERLEVSLLSDSTDGAGGDAAQAWRDGSAAHPWSAAAQRAAHGPAADAAPRAGGIDYLA